jgi:hypothetical protein
MKTAGPWSAQGRICWTDEKIGGRGPMILNKGRSGYGGSRSTRRKVDVDSCCRCFCRMDDMKWDKMYIPGDDYLGVSTLKLALIRGGPSRR